MSRVIKIDNTVIPNPNAGFKVSLEDISDSETGRTLGGEMDKIVVAQKTTVELSWSALPDNRASSLLQLVKGNVYVSLTYPDPVLGTDTTKVFYTGTPSCTLLLCKDNKCYWNVELHFIEK